jgi:phenolic acid decarboxylase
MGAGKAAVKDVADAHEKDLGAQSKHGVNFINYWVDEKKGVIMCLSETSDSNAVKQTHKEAHGLMPAYVMKVKQGQ